MSTFAELAELSEGLAATKSRLRLAELVGTYLKSLPPEEVPLAARLIVGKVFPESEGKKLDVSAATLWRVIRGLIGEADEAVEAAWGEAEDFGEATRLLFQRARVGAGPASSVWTLPQVHDLLDRIAQAKGAGSRKRKGDLLAAYLGQASPLEAKLLAKIVLADMRHGVNEGVLLDAVARASGAPLAAIRRAHMFCGDVGEVARVALTEGAEAVGKIGFGLFRPLKPMLASTADDLDEVLSGSPGGVALEHKIDGARIQIHLKDGEVRLYSRRLNEVTASLPDVVEGVRRNVRATSAILEGEVLAVAPDGRPRPFQDLIRRFRRIHEVPTTLAEIPVRLYLFECLYREGELLIDRPYRERWDALEGVRGDLPAVRRLIPAGPEEARAFYSSALAEGHEGLMAKRVDSPYTPGVRGKLWLKVKRAVSLDLVIVAADYGYGRRHGWLSNYHLAARDEARGEFTPVGKTFKGLTDEEFREMTDRLQRLKVAEEGGTVMVRPEVVVEVLFGDIQKSPLYPCGMALRFARFHRIRDDKSPAEADTVQTMRTLLARQTAQDTSGP